MGRGRGWESSVFTDLGTMEQIYLPLADFFLPNNLAGVQPLFIKKMELGHLIRDRHVTGIFQEGITF